MTRTGRSLTPRKVLPCGDRAVMLDAVDEDEVPALVAAIDAAPLEGLVEVVPGARTLLLRFDPFATTEQAVREYAESIEPLRGGDSASEVVRLPVVYDGADLDDVAEATGLTVDEVVSRHVGGDYVVAFCGFAPGFAYLRGLDPALRVPRLATPRTTVPAGAVALADDWTAVYPRRSPGGWRLIGRTDVTLWDVDADPPALLLPGARVRFEQVMG